MSNESEVRAEVVSREAASGAGRSRYFIYMDLIVMTIHPSVSKDARVMGLRTEFDTMEEAETFANKVYEMMKQDGKAIKWGAVK